MHYISLNRVKLLNTMSCQCIVHSKIRIVVGKGKFKMTVYNFVSQRQKININVVLYVLISCGHFIGRKRKNTGY